MSETYKRRIFFGILLLSALAITGTVLWHTMKESGEEQSLKPGMAYFANATAQPGTPLDVVVLQDSFFASPSYEWYINDVRIDHTGSSYTPGEEDLEKMIAVVVKVRGHENQVLWAYCSRLPVLYVNVDGAADVTDKEAYVGASYMLQGAGESLYENHEGRASIRGRGNYSWWSSPKHSYKFKLDNKENFLGMGKNKHWVLIANYADVSLMRNTLAYRMAGEMGLASMKTQWVSLVMNGSYVGNYQLCQQIRPGSDRVPVTDWEELARRTADMLLREGTIPADKEEALKECLKSDLGWLSTRTFRFEEQTYAIPAGVEIPPLTGGFILEIDEHMDEPTQFRTTLQDQPVMVNAPVYACTNQALTAYAQAYVQAVENAIYAEDRHTVFQGESVHYSDLMDMDSLVVYWLVTEYFYNHDIGRKSVFMYKDIDGKMFMGPIWDMDWSSGRENIDVSSDQWATLAFGERAQGRHWYKELVKDPDFLHRAYELYHQYRPVLQSFVEDGGKIDQYYAYLYESGMANEALGKMGRSFTEDATIYMKQWFQDRLDWMDRQFASEETLTRSLNPAKSGSVE